MVKSLERIRPRCVATGYSAAVRVRDRQVTVWWASWQIRTLWAPRDGATITLAARHRDSCKYSPHRYHFSLLNI